MAMKSKLKGVTKGQGVTSGMTLKGVTSVMLTARDMAELMAIARALDKDTQGLAGKRENMMDLVRYAGKTMREVRVAIEAFQG